MYGMHDLKCPLVSYVRENIHPYDFRTIGNEFYESCFGYDGLSATDKY